VTSAPFAAVETVTQIAIALPKMVRHKSKNRLLVILHLLIGKLFWREVAREASKNSRLFEIARVLVGANDLDRGAVRY
jgi:hypothetical protein